MKYLISLLATVALCLFAVGQEVPKVKDAEFGKGYIPLTPEKRAFYQKASRAAHGGRIAMLEKFTALPPAFDCREKGWLLKTGNQGSCGSCYLYATIYGTLTCSFIIAGYGKNDGSFAMATQFGMDCHNFGGCNGGNGTEVIDWVMKNGWPAETYVDLMGKVHNDYPSYSARSQACRKVDGAKMWKPASWGFVNANRAPTVGEIKATIHKFGPVNIAVDAGGQFGQGVGTITVLGRNINHEINCVGWDDNHDNGDGTKGAFLLWNQWGEGWGNGGFRWVSYNASRNIVDWFFISVDPLPAPPPDPEPEPPPVPPGPGPIPPGVQLKMITETFSDGSSRRYDVLPVGSAQKIQELLDILSPKVEGTKEPPLADPSTKRIDELEKHMHKLLDQMDDLRKLIGGEKKVPQPQGQPAPKQEVSVSVDWLRLIADEHNRKMGLPAVQYFSKP